MQVQAEVRQTILDWLDRQTLLYRLFEHERANTIDDCLRMPFINNSITICKNVFLCNRQQTQFYLMLLRPDTPFRTAVVSKALGVSRLSFAPETYLESFLHLTSGSVSPLGLYFDTQKQINLCYEKEIRDTPEIAFHPCDNTATVIFSQDVFWDQVIPALGVVPVGLENVRPVEPTGPACQMTPADPRGIACP